MRSASCPPTARRCMFSFESRCLKVSKYIPSSYILPCFGFLCHCRKLHVHALHVCFPFLIDVLLIFQMHSACCHLLDSVLCAKPASKYSHVEEFKFEDALRSHPRPICSVQSSFHLSSWLFVYASHRWWRSSYMYWGQTGRHRYQYQHGTMRKQSPEVAPPCPLKRPSQNAMI